MRVRSVLVAALGLAALAGACGRVGLQPLDPEDPPPADASAPSPDSRDAAAATDGDAPDPDAPEAIIPVRAEGSFIIQSLFQYRGGTAISPTSEHYFTLVLDPGELSARVGNGGGGGKTRVKPAGDLGIELIDRVTIALGDTCDGEVVYEGMTLTATSDGQITGEGTGLVRFTRANLVETVVVTMKLRGRRDTDPPRLDFANHSSPGEPFQWLELLPSEPLPDSAKPTLVSNSGEIVPLVPVFLADRGLPVFRPAKALLLRFDETYRVDTKGLVDFAGNAAREEPRFMTRAAPAVLIEDGFESAKEEDLGGAKLITTGDALPVISGNKSFYLPPEEGQPSDTMSLFTLRVAVRPGATKIRFSYRTVDVPRGAGNGLAMVFVVGSVGKTIGAMGSGPPNEPKTTVELPVGRKVLVGPLQQEVLGVPSDATDEVFVAAYGGTATCKLPSPPQQGIIIDDVRVK